VERNSSTHHCDNSDSCSTELPLRGHRESLIGEPNPGNFLALLKYLAKFDPVMREHLDSVSGKPGYLSYLSPDVQNELVNLLGARRPEGQVLQYHIGYDSRQCAHRTVVAHCQTC
jgi:hypothetical protein